jgi:hypothetical protein
MSLMSRLKFKSSHVRSEKMPFGSTLRAPTLTLRARQSTPGTGYARWIHRAICATWPSGVSTLVVPTEYETRSNEMLIRGTVWNETGAVPPRTLLARFASGIVPFGLISARSDVCPDVAKVGSSNRNPYAGSPRLNLSTRADPMVSTPSGSRGSRTETRDPLRTVSVASEMHEPVGTRRAAAPLCLRPGLRGRSKGVKRWL